MGSIRALHISLVFRAYGSFPGFQGLMLWASGFFARGFGLKGVGCRLRVYGLLDSVIKAKIHPNTISAPTALNSNGRSWDPPKNAQP